MQDTISTNTLRIYGCGGFGINIASHYHERVATANFAEVAPAFIDTSRSNLLPGFAEEDIFVVRDVDGSGKIRRENSTQIANAIKQVLLQIKPGNFNLVVFSASGGSGSVIGPLLLAELAARKLPAVALVVGSDESLITADNTMKTLKSMESIATRNDQPVVMYYDHNDRDMKRSAINAQFHHVISTLAVLTSGRNRELDSRDVINWVQFNRATSVAPQLACLEVFLDRVEAEKISDPISIASVFKDQDAANLATIPEYQCTGYLTGNDDEIEEVHLIISIDTVPKIYGEINQTLKRYEDQRDSRVKQERVLSSNDQVDDDTGLVF